LSNIFLRIIIEKTFFIKKIKMQEITWQDFEKVEIRVGTILKVEDFPEVRNPAYKLEVDLGEKIGIKKSSAQITHLYKKEDLIGKQVLCVCNFPPKQIANFFSEVLTCGFYLPTKEVVLALPDKSVPNGSKLA
jgi:tRNA-binding protein